MKRKSVLGILLPFGLALLLTACGQAKQTGPEVEHTPSKEPVLMVTSHPPISELEQSDSPASTTAAASSSAAPEESTPKLPAKTEGNHAAATSSAPEVIRSIEPPVTSRPTAPPETSTPSPEIPAASVSEPETSTSQPSTPPTISGQTDGQAIIKQIREYGETKGFVWNDTLTIGGLGVGYYGRPNLVDDGAEGVVSMLKYHCDKIEREYGICYFHTIQRKYEGKTEFIVLYA